MKNKSLNPIKFSTLIYATIFLLIIFKSDFSNARQVKFQHKDSVVFQIDTISSKLTKKIADNTLFIDFGKDAFGTLLLKYNTKILETITIRLGEQLNENGLINRNPEGSIRYQEVTLKVKPEQKEYLLNLKPDKRNTLPAAVKTPKSFPVIMPFRYAEIEGNNLKISKNDVYQIAYHTYFDDNKSYFSSSNEVLNQVWAMCKYTIKATSFTGLYVDGDRERIPYEADAYINQLGAYTTNNDYNIAKNTIEYFMEHPTWPTEWQLHVALMLEQDYMYTGSTSLIEKYYEEAKHKTLIALTDENGLISTKSTKLTKAFMKDLGFKDSTVVLRDIVDWPPAQKDTGWKLATAEGERDGFVFMPFNTVINALYFKNMEVMAHFAKILNKPNDEAIFLANAAKAKSAINQLILNQDTGIYTDGIGTTHSSIHANMFALAFNLVPQKNIKPVVDFIKSRGMACSVYGSQYLMEALYNAREADYALSLMTSKDDRSWYNMIRVGATMTMEAWDMKNKPNSDWNHAWGTVPANAIPRLMWGITPKTAGASVINIEPQLGSLQQSKIKVPFIGGEVYATFNKKGNRQKFTFIIPQNMKADLKLNVSSKDQIILDGKNADSTLNGIIKLEPGIHQVELISSS